MKKLIILIAITFGWVKVSLSQYYYQMYYDPEHFASVSANQVTRMAAETILTNQTKKIKENIETINQNMLKVVATKELIYRSLTEVNEVLKDGKEIKYIGTLITDIAEEAMGVTQLAKDAPHLAIFAEESARNIRTQSLELFSEITRFINKGGTDAMMNYNTRDELLRNITHRLQLLRAEIYLMHQSMYWAKMNGIWNTLNPFSDWINEDRNIINGILLNVKLIQE